MSLSYSLSTGSLCCNRKMNKYMHGTDENQVAYHFCFRVELISKVAKVTELLWYILNIIGLCMFLNLPNV